MTESNPNPTPGRELPQGVIDEEAEAERRRSQLNDLASLSDTDAQARVPGVALTGTDDSPNPGKKLTPVELIRDRRPRGE